MNKLRPFPSAHSDRHSLIANANQRLSSLKDQAARINEDTQHQQHPHDHPHQERLLMTITELQKENQRLEEDNEMLLEQARRKRMEEAALASEVKRLKSKLEYYESKRPKELDIYMLNVKGEETMLSGVTSKTIEGTGDLEELERRNEQFQELFRKVTKGGYPPAQMNRMRAEMMQIADETKALRERISGKELT